MVNLRSTCGRFTNAPGWWHVVPGPAAAKRFAMSQRTGFGAPELEECKCLMKFDGQIDELNQAHARQPVQFCMVWIWSYSSISCIYIYCTWFHFVQGHPDLSYFPKHDSTSTTSSTSTRFVPSCWFILLQWQLTEKKKICWESAGDMFPDPIVLTMKTASPKPRYTDAGSAGAGYLADALLTGVGFTNGTCGQERKGDVLL